MSVPPSGRRHHHVHPDNITMTEYDVMSNDSMATKQIALQKKLLYKIVKLSENNILVADICLYPK